MASVPFTKTNDEGPKPQLHDVGVFEDKSVNKTVEFNAGVVLEAENSATGGTVVE